MAENWAKGYDGKIVLGSTTLNVQSWEISEDGTNSDTTHTGGAGVETVIPTTNAYTGTFEATLDLDATLDSTTPTIRRGSTAAAQFFVSSTEKYALPVVLLSVRIVMEVKETITYACTWQGTGTFTSTPS